MTPRTLAISSAVIVAALGLGTVYYTVQTIREKTCQSYESQLTANFRDAVSVLDRTLSMKAAISDNGLAALAFVQPVLEEQAKAQEIKKKVNDLKYAFAETCSPERYNQYLDKPEVASLRREIKTKANQLSGN